MDDGANGTTKRAAMGDDNYNPPRQHKEIRSDIAYLLWLWVVVLIPFTLIYSNLSSTRECWVLHPGQSRGEVFPSLLTRSIATREINTAYDHADADIYVHQFYGGCPPLTGPPIRTNTTAHVKLRPGRYRYTEYFLNKGSVVNVSVTTQRGDVEVFLFRQWAFEAWTENPDYMFRLTPLRRNHTGPVLSTHVEHEVLESDTFFLVLYNGFEKTSELKASVVVEMTTHNLGVNPPMTPKSSCSSDGSECLVQTDVRPWRTQCTVVQVGNGTNASGKGKEDDTTVTLEVVKNRRWSIIYLLTAIPFILLLGHQRRTAAQCTAKRSSDRNGDDDPGPFIIVNPTEVTPLTQHRHGQKLKKVHWASPIDAPLNALSRASALLSPATA